MSNETQGDDETVFSQQLLRGADEIAEYVFGHRKFRRRIYYLAEKTNFPCFRIGSRICALKSVLRAHFH